MSFTMCGRMCCGTTKSRYGPSSWQKIAICGNCSITSCLTDCSVIQIQKDNPNYYFYYACNGYDISNKEKVIHLSRRALNGMEKKREKQSVQTKAFRKFSPSSAPATTSTQASFFLPALAHFPKTLMLRLSCIICIASLHHLPSSDSPFPSATASHREVKKELGGMHELFGLSNADVHNMQNKCWAWWKLEKHTHFPSNPASFRYWTSTSSNNYYLVEHKLCQKQCHSCWWPKPAASQPP